MNQTRRDTIVIGGGQAGLSVGYHLKQLGLPFVIVDAQQRVGDSWRHRWDSLRLFTPARYNGLDGLPFPAPSHYFPTKDEMADYLETYASHFDLPVHNGLEVSSLKKVDGHFWIKAGERQFEANNVVVAMSSWQEPRLPAVSRNLHPDIFQIHSAEYRNPGQLRDGPVLIAGAGNSGAEIALELAKEHKVLLSGPNTGHVPVRIERQVGRLVVAIVRFIFHHILTTSTPIGRKARPKMIRRGEPLVRTKPKDLASAGVERVPRVVGSREGLPLLEDGKVAEVANVIWSTGFEPGFSWIDLPVFDGDHWPVHQRGVVESQPGIYFVGLKFLYSVSSGQVNGVGRDAARIARAIADRSPASNPSETVHTRLASDGHN